MDMVSNILQCLMCHKKTKQPTNKLTNNYAKFCKCNPRKASHHR